ncbi:MAG: hypothetical protein V4736_05615 [Bdellovibrionota bacterium]
MDLFIRLCKNWELAYVPVPLSKWRVHQKSWTFQKLELFPVEREQFLEKMKRLFPGFENEYADEVKSIKALIAFEKANLQWRKGNKTVARELIAPHAATSRKLKIYYYFMYMNPKIFDFFNQFRSVGI